MYMPLRVYGHMRTLLDSILIMLRVIFIFGFM